MQHAKQKRTLGRTRSQRTALLRGLAISLFEHGSIVTSTAKAKELQPFAERLVTYGKQGTVAARRNAATKLGEPNTQVVSKLFDEIAPKYADRSGGYTRIIKMGIKDGRDQSVIELV
ncbi:MAG TPA: 50S ribosomal protein L17 [Candidatus Paceibacterota bacterium]|nr:50S ribosomal protein L17 [Candidatus Paceibacterota bacterium]